MDQLKKSAAEACLAGSESNTMTFPQIIGVLTQTGFESYAVDFRRATATYYLPDGDSLELSMHRIEAPVAPTFDAVRIQAAIKEAQQLVPGYTYKNFCQKAVAAGCVGYVVSFPGRRVAYMGRTAEFHVEHFPN